MKTFLRIVLKPLSFIPALLIMYCIYSFSAQNGTQSSNVSYEVSYRIVAGTDKVLNLELSNAQIAKSVWRIHHYVRKVAHFTEYLLLAASVAIPFYVYGLRGIWLLLTTQMICTGFASLDEFHQLFVSGRSASPRDVLIDSAGAFIGIILTNLVCYVARKSVFEPLGLHKKK